MTFLVRLVPLSITLIIATIKIDKMAYTLLIHQFLMSPEYKVINWLVLNTVRCIGDRGLDCHSILRAGLYHSLSFYRLLLISARFA